MGSPTSTGHIKQHQTVFSVKMICNPVGLASCVQLLCGVLLIILATIAGQQTLELQDEVISSKIRGNSFFFYIGIFSLLVAATGSMVVRNASEIVKIICALTNFAAVLLKLAFILCLQGQIDIIILCVFIMSILSDIGCILTIFRSCFSGDKTDSTKDNIVATMDEENIIVSDLYFSSEIYRV